MHIRLNDYFRKDFRFSYFRTKDGVEIDLIIDRPGESLSLVEIKSSESPTLSDVKHLVKLREEFGRCEAFWFSNSTKEHIDEGIHFLHWKSGLKKVGLVSVYGWWGSDLFGVSEPYPKDPFQMIEWRSRSRVDQLSKVKIDSDRIQF